MNTVISEEEIKALEDVNKAVKNLIEVLKSGTPNFADIDNQLVRIHTLLILDSVKDLISANSVLESLLKESEEEMVKHITEISTLDEFERTIITKMMGHILMEHILS